MATLKFDQVSKSAAESKMKRLVGNTLYGTIGFCNITLKRTSEEEYRMTGQREFWIEMASTYHEESTMQKMYKTNGKSW